MTIPLSSRTMFPDLSRPLSKGQRKVLYVLERATLAYGGLTANEVQERADMASRGSTWATLNKLIKGGLVRRVDTLNHGYVYSVTTLP